MDALVPAFLLHVFAFILAFDQGALGSTVDACKGLCDNRPGEFCEPFIGICLPCEHCNTGDGNGCRPVCDAWKTTTSSTPGIASTTRPFPAQTTINTTMSTQVNTTSTNKGISLMGGGLSDTGTTSPPDITETLGLWLAILFAGIIAMIVGYCCWQHKKTRKRKNHNRQAVEIQRQDDVELQQLHLPRREEQAQCVAPLLPIPGHGSQETIPLSVPADKVEVVPELPDSGFNSAPYGTATVHEQASLASQGSMSLPGPLRSKEPGMEVELNQGAVPGGGTRQSLPVPPQDGTHHGHEYAVYTSPISLPHLK